MPARIPTVLKIAAGCDKKNPQMFRNVEPEFQAVKYVEPPDDLRPEAQEKWRELLPQLIESKVITKGDMGVFRRLCELHWAYCDAMSDVLTHGTTVETLNYGVKTNPALTNALQTAKELRTLEGKFGLNPADRGSLDLGQKTKKSFASRRRSQE